MKRRIFAISLLICSIVYTLGTVVTLASEATQDDYGKICFVYRDGNIVYPNDKEELDNEIVSMQKQSHMAEEGFLPGYAIYFKDDVDPVKAFENAKDVIAKLQYEELRDYTDVHYVKEPYVGLTVLYENVAANDLVMLAKCEWIRRVEVRYPHLVYPDLGDDFEEPPASETGDGAVYGVTVLGVAAAALTVLLLRKKKI